MSRTYRTTSNTGDTRKAQADRINKLRSVTTRRITHRDAEAMRERIFSAVYAPKKAR